VSRGPSGPPPRGWGLACETGNEWCLVAEGFRRGLAGLWIVGHEGCARRGSMGRRSSRRGFVAVGQDEVLGIATAVLVQVAAPRYRFRRRGGTRKGICDRLTRASTIRRVSSLAGRGLPTALVATWRVPHDRKRVGRSERPRLGDGLGAESLLPARETRRRRTVTGIAQRVVVPCRRLNAGSRFGRR